MSRTQIGLSMLGVLVGAALISGGGRLLHFPTKPAQPLNPVQLGWDMVASSSPWEARDSAAAFVFDNKMWIMGGLDGNNVPAGAHHAVEYEKAPYFNDIWNTDDGVTWHLVATSTDWAPRRSMSVVEFNGSLWMFGGWSPSEGYQSDVWQSHDAIHWTRVVRTAALTPREGQWVDVFQGKLWMTGGVNYDEHTTFHDVWYSEDGVTWIQAPDAPWPSRWDHATAVFDGKLWMTGGMDLGAHKDLAYNDEWYTEDGMTWTKVTDNAVWPPRQGHMLIPYGGYLWIMGRLNDDIDGGVNDVWYSKDGITWTEGLAPGWSGREDFWTLVFKGRMWVFSGMDYTWHWTNDVWVSATSTAPVPPTLSATAAYVAYLGTPQTDLFVKNADAPLPLASVSKLMTAVTAVDRYGYAPIADTLAPMLIVSDNSKADALAAREGLDIFVPAMNATAAQLGLSSMHFINPSGLDPHDGSSPNTGSARDVASLLSYIHTSQPELFTLLGQKQYGDATNTDALLFDPSLFILGGKTGETPLALQNLAVIARAPNGGAIVAVVLHSTDRVADMRALLSYVTSSFTW